MKKFLFLIILLICPIFVNAEELIGEASSGILIEAGSGKIIYEKEKDKRVSVASLTKMVAQIIILEEIENKKIKWSDIVTVSRNASDMGGSQIYLEEGEKITVEDLMKGISVASGNDATVAMAEYISGSEKNFVKRMNKKAKDLGLKNTHFSNCTGLDEDNHYSSSYDMSVIARDLVINHPNILKFSSIYEDYLRENTENKFWLVNTNKLIRGYEGCDGLKTGHTDAAGYCLAATAKKNNIRLIAIVLGEKDSKERNKETINLLEYGYKNIKVKKLKSKNTSIKKIYLNKANPKYLDIILKRDLNVVEDKSKRKKYKYKIRMKKIELPIKQGEVVGEIRVINDSKIVSQGTLISAFDIDKATITNYYKDSLFSYVTGDL